MDELLKFVEIECPSEIAELEQTLIWINDSSIFRLGNDMESPIVIDSADRLRAGDKVLVNVSVDELPEFVAEREAKQKHILEAARLRRLVFAAKPIIEKVYNDTTDDQARAVLRGTVASIQEYFENFDVRDMMK